MFKTKKRYRKAERALKTQRLSIKAVRLRDVEPRTIPIELRSNRFWQQISDELGHGVMFVRNSFQIKDEVAVSCLWEEGAMMHPMYHPDTDKFIYVIHGALKELNTGAILYPGERLSVKNIIDGTTPSQPYVISAGTAHFLQAIEPDTFFIIKFKHNDNPDHH